jgi:hypothetical protein
VLLIVAAAAVACAREPAFDTRAEGDPRLARRQLADALAAGPVPLVVVGAPEGLSEARIAGLAERGVRGLTVRFTTVDEPTVDEPAESGRLVLAFGATPRRTSPCAAPADAPSGPYLTAAWCAGGRPLAIVHGTAADAGRAGLERLVWQATGRLFEDDYAESYGLDLFGLKVRFGAAVGL